MTDEELAKIRSAEFTDERGIEYFSYRAGFLAGLKEGRPKWHDLRNNPNDLPTCDCETITIYENGNKNIQKWKNGNWTNAIVIPVIAWCEIPQYKEE